MPVAMLSWMVSPLLGDNPVPILWTSWCGDRMVSIESRMSPPKTLFGLGDMLRISTSTTLWYCAAQFSVQANSCPQKCLRISRSNGQSMTTLSKRRLRIRTREIIRHKARNLVCSCWRRSVRASPTLMLDDVHEVEPHAALSDLGLDSVMTVALRKRFQSSMHIEVPPTLTWSHPTSQHLVGWFKDKLQSVWYGVRDANIRSLSISTRKLLVELL
jgi:acyl carrier protein